MRCNYCGAGTHTVNLCPSTARGSSNRLRLRCTYCGHNDHSIQACPKTYSGSAARAWYPDKVAEHFKKD